MANRDRDTFIHRRGVTPETMSVISQKNRIYAIPADGDSVSQAQIGVVASFDPSETRAIEPVRGIGFGDHVAELVPGVTDPMTLAVTRTAQYMSGIYQVFGYKGGIDGLVRSLRHHKYPFDIRQEIVVSRLEKVSKELSEQEGSSGGIESYDTDFDGSVQAIITLYEGCWMSDYSTSYASDTALVQENVTVNVTDILADSSSLTEGSEFLFNDLARSSILDTSTGSTL